MRNTSAYIIHLLTPLAFLGCSSINAAELDMPEAGGRYSAYVQQCMDVLLEHGTDEYGKVHTPVLVSILDVKTRRCPSDPKPCDEYFRVTRRKRRSPAGANLLIDQPTLRTMYCLSAVTGNDDYADFADSYAEYVLDHLVDEKGFFWWGWHRHYDVHKDIKDGHNGNYHEIHAITCIDWKHLWQVDKDAVIKEIEAVWRWHVIDKKTGEVNRHGDGRGGCDFSMSAGAFIEAFAFMHARTQDQKWLDRAKLLADYYWNRRNPETGLFPDRPNAGEGRFDGSSFVTSITGLHCHSLLKAFELTDDTSFRDYAVAYLKAYAEYGFDDNTKKFRGALRMDGSPIPGPRIAAGYAAYQARGHLDLWEPYVAGYQYAVYTAQAYAYAYHLTGDEALLTAAERFADWISKTSPGTVETENTWYKEYSIGPGRQGTYAGKYGRVMSFLLHMYILTGDREYLDQACLTADAAIEKLYHKGLFRGHPAKPYYEAMDGVGYLLYALLELDQVLEKPALAVSNKKLLLGAGNLRMPLDNW